jgi:hypothetical protein
MRVSSELLALFEVAGFTAQEKDRAMGTLMAYVIGIARTGSIGSWTAWRPGSARPGQRSPIAQGRAFPQTSPDGRERPEDPWQAVRHVENDSRSRPPRRRVLTWRTCS